MMCCFVSMSVCINPFIHYLLLMLLCLTRCNTYTFNSPYSGTTQVSWYQKGKTDLDFTEARDNEWHWHQLGRMQVCTSLQIDNHASTPPLIFYRPDALPAVQPLASNALPSAEVCKYQKTILGTLFCPSNVPLVPVNWQVILVFYSYLKGLGGTAGRYKSSISHTHTCTPV